MTEWLQQSHITLQTEIVKRQRAEEARRQRENELRLNIPVILCTGFSETMDAEQAYALGINAFLMKPLELRKLGSATHDVLAQQTKAA